jgi:hypothetical protein
MGYLEALAALIPLLILIFKELFSAQARAREENRTFVLNAEALRAIVHAAVEKHIAMMAEVSQGAGNAWDAADGRKDDGRP